MFYYCSLNVSTQHYQRLNVWCKDDQSIIIAQVCTAVYIDHILYLLQDWLLLIKVTSFACLSWNILVGSTFILKGTPVGSPTIQLDLIIRYSQSMCTHPSVCMALQYQCLVKSVFIMFVFTCSKILVILNMYITLWEYCRWHYWLGVCICKYGYSIIQILIKKW